MKDSKKCSAQNLQPPFELIFLKKIFWSYSRRFGRQQRYVLSSTFQSYLCSVYQHQFRGPQGVNAPLRRYKHWNQSECVQVLLTQCQCVGALGGDGEGDNEVGAWGVGVDQGGTASPEPEHATHHLHHLTGADHTPEREWTTRLALTLHVHTMIWYTRTHFEHVRMVYRFPLTSLI